MEPVPETERMEEFRSSPLPTLRLHNSSSFTFASPTPLSPRSSSDSDNSLRKPYPRRPTEPASPVSPSWSSPPPLPYRPRTTSPLSGSHMRSRSTASIGSLYPPAMGRTQSMPGVNGAGHLQFRRDPRSSSPSLGHRPPALTMRTPKKSLVEDVFPSSPTRMSVIHDSDRQLHERNSSPNLGIHTLPSIPDDSVSELGIVSQPLARTRRPASPYRRVSPSSGPTSAPGPTHSAPALISSASSPLPISSFSSFSGGIIGTIAESPSAPSLGTPSSSAASSPVYRPSDMLLSAPSYSSLGGLSSSSVPSTPTSTRSRSPSISSLETIPDSPDAEEAALEAERIAQLKAAAEAAENGDGKKGGSMDAPTRGRTLAFGSRDKRKRWSVCGAERRGDLDLETIWED
ncbi:basic proline-rich protein [Ophiostoma piceae UAMH 11346]|uniref:Basic proline-rich protein n=1 Tax=Ophiostoma piceae (strain UAMH 11346) TaxID=1262450 RepID=S3CBU9_OPHP1|nr:basic proline-rich protein [Ophiostoma piceae UAMH 11346]